MTNAVTTMTSTSRISIADLESAFEWASIDSFPECEARISRATGEVFLFGGDSSDDGSFQTLYGGPPQPPPQPDAGDATSVAIYGGAPPNGDLP